MSKSLCCTEPPARSNCLAHVLMLFSPDSLRLLSQQAPAKYPSLILQIRALLPTSSSRLSWSAAAAFSSHFLGADKSHVNPDIAFKCQGVPMRPLFYPNHGSRTQLLLQVLLPASMIEPLEFASSTLLFSRCHFPVQTPFAQYWVAKVRPYASTNKDKEVVLFLPAAAAAICLLNFNLSA